MILQFTLQRNCNSMLTPEEAVLRIINKRSQIDQDEPRSGINNNLHDILLRRFVKIQSRGQSAALELAALMLRDERVGSTEVRWRKHVSRKPPTHFLCSRLNPRPGLAPRTWGTWRPRPRCCGLRWRAHPSEQDDKICCPRLPGRTHWFQD